jgi:hypothetical protein
MKRFVLSAVATVAVALMFTVGSASAQFISVGDFGGLGGAKYRYTLDWSNPAGVSCVKTPKDCEIKKRDGVWEGLGGALVSGPVSSFSLSSGIINQPVGW